MSADVKTVYKLTEVGVIPEDWEVKPLYTICTAILDCHHSTPVWTKSGEFVIRNQNIRDGKLNFSVPSFTDEKHFLERTQRAIPTFGDLIITREAPMGLVCMIPEGLKCCLGQRMVLLRIDQHSTAHRFVLYALLGESVQRYISVVGGTGSTVSNLRIPVLRGLKIATPKKAEQEAIAEALSDADALIESLEQLITKKRQIKQSAMQELLTGKNRLPGFSGAWEVKKLGDVVKISKGQLITEKNAISGDIPVIAGGKKPAYFHNKPNRTGTTITVSASGASAGYVALFDEPIFASDCSTISEGDGYSIDFIYSQLQLKQDIIYKAQTGGAQPHIHTDDLMPIEIGVPSLAEQKAIAIILSDMDSEIDMLAVKLEKARHLKQGMMHNLLTGKIRLV